MNLLDEAIPVLDWKQTPLNDGRMSRAGAMGLKVQVLLWAASPTFNSDEKWHPEADEYTCYGNYNKAVGKELRQLPGSFLPNWKVNPNTP